MNDWSQTDYVLTFEEMESALGNISFNSWQGYDYFATIEFKNSQFLFL